MPGLKAKPELNGSNGVVLNYDAEKGRFNVRLDDADATVVALKPTNLTEQQPPPPAGGSSVPLAPSPAPAAAALVDRCRARRAPSDRCRARRASAARRNREAPPTAPPTPPQADAWLLAALTESDPAKLREALRAAPAEGALAELARQQLSSSRRSARRTRRGGGGGAAGGASR